MPRRSPAGETPVPQALPARSGSLGVGDGDGVGDGGPAGGDTVGVGRGAQPDVHVSARLHRADRGQLLQRLQRPVQRGRGRAPHLPKGLPRRSVHATRGHVHAGRQLLAGLPEVLYDLWQLRDGCQLHTHRVDEHHDDQRDEHHDEHVPPVHRRRLDLRKLWSWYVPPAVRALMHPGVRHLCPDASPLHDRCPVLSRPGLRSGCLGMSVALRRRQPVCLRRSMPMTNSRCTLMRPCCRLPSHAQDRPSLARAVHRYMAA